jgi:Tfp pilus assembly protein PilF
VPLAELGKLKVQLAERSEPDVWSRLARWLFAEAATRTLSPLSEITVDEYVQSRATENTVDSLEEALKMAPTNALVLARLARAVLAPNPRQNPRQPAEADWYSRRALELAPQAAESWWARAQALDRAGNLSRALEAIKAGLELHPQHPDLWHEQGLLLEQANRADEAYQSFTRAI